MEDCNVCKENEGEMLCDFCKRVICKRCRQIVEIGVDGDHYGADMCIRCWLGVNPQEFDIRKSNFHLCQLKEYGGVTSTVYATWRRIWRFDINVQFHFSWYERKSRFDVGWFYIRIRRHPLYFRLEVKYGYRGKESADQG